MEVIKGERLGEGGFGTVYRGMNKATGELVAIKEIKLNGCRESDVQDLLREMRTLQGLSHPNIIKFLGFARSAELGTIVMEFAPGGSLHTLMLEFRAIAEPVMGRYTRQILLGLQYLHASGVVHRDIKPLNVLLDSAGNVKLADFGASRQLTDLSTVATGLMGTPIYMAPEVVRFMKVSRAGDIWSLGCTCLEAMTGARPWAELGNVPLVSLVFHIGSATGPPQISSCLSELARDFLLQTFRPQADGRPTAEALLEHPFVAETAVAAAAGHTTEFVRVEAARNVNDKILAGAKAGRHSDTITIDSLDSLDDSAGYSGSSGSEPAPAGSEASYSSYGPSPGRSAYPAYSVSPRARSTQSARASVEGPPRKEKEEKRTEEEPDSWAGPAEVYDKKRKKASGGKKPLAPGPASKPVATSPPALASKAATLSAPAKSLLPDLPQAHSGPTAKFSKKKG